MSPDIKACAGFAGAHGGVSANWMTCNPPMDGTPIVAIGRAITTWGDETTVEGWCAAVTWSTEPGGSGWMYHYRGEAGPMAVQCYWQQEIIVDYWLPMPEGQK